MTDGQAPAAVPLRQNRREALKGHAAMLLFSALVAGSFSLGGMIADQIAPTAFNALRFWLAAGVAVAVVVATGGAPRSAARAPWRYLILGGLFAAYFVAMFEGLKTAPPVSTAAVFTMTPVMAAGFGFVLLGQRTGPVVAAGLGLGAVGALWVIFRADLAAVLAFDVGRGEAIYFLGCIAHAIYTPMIARLNRGERPAVFNAGTLLACAAILTLWGLPAIRTTDWGGLPTMVWVTLGYTAFLASAVTGLLVQFATLRLPSAKVMAYTYLTPSWVLLWEIALGQPAPRAAVLAGIALSAAALTLLLRGEPAETTRR